MQLGEAPKGRLVQNSKYPDYYTCETCGTDYPFLRVYKKDREGFFTGEFRDVVVCNHQEITVCPYCSFKQGRWLPSNEETHT